jgi:hypothetical protein
MLAITFFVINQNMGPSEWGNLSGQQHTLQIFYKLTELEVTELTSKTIDEKALALLKRHGRHGMRIVSSQGKFIFDSSNLSILIHSTNQTHQAGNKELAYCRITPSHVE